MRNQEAEQISQGRALRNKDALPFFWHWGYGLHREGASPRFFKPSGYYYDLCVLPKKIKYSERQ